MKYLIDTDIVIDLLNGERNILEKLKRAGQFGVCISAITVAELYYGAYHSSRVEEN